MMATEQNPHLVIIVESSNVLIYLAITRANLQLQCYQNYYYI